MRVWIAEKPSVGCELAKYLGKGRKRTAILKLPGQTRW
ncbi:hypothetical protein MAMMFC1_03206 [Methylomusa anaerophila]|uniref:Uncharacterized protein n=1 Tax=Methylomusa anaerophila TaxID=1930071 RepID=A0A348AN65_9FIRM|nr:hypothetical protein MAMMFC1_03206 [Methylomusa anaerophila]